MRFLVSSIIAVMALFSNVSFANEHYLISREGKLLTWNYNGYSYELYCADPENISFLLSHGNPTVGSDNLRSDRTWVKFGPLRINVQNCSYTYFESD